MAKDKRGPGGKGQRHPEARPSPEPTPEELERRAPNELGQQPQQLQVEAEDAKDSPPQAGR